MNTWNGLPGIPGMTDAVGPFSMGNYGAVSAPYMTPAGGSEILSPITPAPALTPISASIPGIAGPDASKGWLGIDGLGANFDTLKLGVGALGSIASLWNASQQNKLARASFNHQKGILDTNLANQIKSYNLSLDDKLRSRQVMEGTSDAAREEARRKWEATDNRRG